MNQNDNLTVESALRLGEEFLRSFGVQAARLEIELILAEVMGVDRIGLYVNLKRRMTAEHREGSREMLSRRREREPLAYILGRREFYGLGFEVNRSVLVPRPETEGLVDLILEGLKKWDSAGDDPLLADIGTGSGAIAVAAAAIHKRKGPCARWIATDVSNEALDLARKNAERHGVADQIDFRLGSMLEPLDGPVDFLCSNPPYVAESERATLMPEVVEWEPEGALFSGPEGTEHLKALIGAAPDYVCPGGFLLLEIGIGQAENVARWIEEAPGLELIEIHDDLAGIPRIVEASRRR